MPSKKRGGSKGRPAGSPSEGAVRRIEEAAKDRYLLRLYVSGSTPRSANAIANIKRICEESLEGRYELEVIDVLQSGTLKDDDIVAVPTLIKRLPTPLRRLIGDLSEKERVLQGLGLKKEGD